MVEELLFSAGDFVVYPTHGVGKVVDIETQEVAGHKLKMFVISFDQENIFKCRLTFNYFIRSAIWRIVINN